MESKLDMIYKEVKLINRRLDLLEDLVEEMIIKNLPEAKLSEEEIKEIKKAVDEMKRGNYITLEDLKDI